MIYVLSEVEDAVRESRVVKLKCGAFVALRGVGITATYPGYFLVDTGDRVWPEVYFPREVLEPSNEDNNEVVQVLYPVVSPVDIARLQQERDVFREWGDAACIKYKELLADIAGLRQERDEARALAEESCRKYKELLRLVDEYLGNGGLFNPELMQHDKVRDLVLSLREMIRIQALETGRSQKHD